MKKEVAILVTCLFFVLAEIVAQPVGQVSAIPITAYPNPSGVSAPFVGTSEGMLLVGGGCNFPDMPVWEGGKKKYYADLYALPVEESLFSIHWSEPFKLPYPVAYGASVSTPNGIVCVGGMNADSLVSSVLLIRWDRINMIPVIDYLPSLPFPMDNLSATFWGNKVYALGGNASGKAANTFLALDMGNSAQGWTVLPSFPGNRRVQPVAIAQQAAVYLGGGFDESVAHLPGTLLKFSIERKAWETITSFPIDQQGDTITVSGGGGVPLGNDKLLFTCGVNNQLFQISLKRSINLKEALTMGDSSLIKELMRQGKTYLMNPPEWYRFNQQLLVYDIVNDTWTLSDSHPKLARAGAGVILCRDRLFIINGEVKPGVRTPLVTAFSF